MLFAAFWLYSCDPESSSSSEGTIPKKWVRVAVGYVHTLAINDAGELYTWGRNTKGQLGIGSTESKNAPTQVGTATNWTAVAGGEVHSLALKRDGTLYAWGSNDDNQLGSGMATGTNTPVQVGTDTDWRAIYAGKSTSFAIKNDNTLYAWGLNAGQYGDGTTTGASKPRKVSSDTDWKALGLGVNFSVLGLKSDGTLYGSGYNTNKQLGIGTAAQTATFTRESTGAANWKTISAGQDHSLAINDAGELYAWGNNSNGQLGMGTSGSSIDTPTKVNTATDWAAIVGGAFYSLILKKDGSLYAWGLNINGRLGDGTTTNRTSPTKIGNATDWTTIVGSSGSAHSLALKKDGTLYAWGRNNHGQLGDNTTEDKNTPTLIPHP